MASQWYYAQGGQQLGPVTSEQLKQLAQTGQLNPTDLIWKDGLAEWTPARKVAGLFSTAAAASHAANSAAPAAVATAPTPAYAAPLPAPPAYSPATSTQPPGAYPAAASTGYAAGSASTDYPQAAYGQGYALPAPALAYEAPTSEALVITPRSIDMLRQTRPWVLFLGIVGFVSAALIVVAGLFALVMAAGASIYSGPPIVVILLLDLVLYGGMAILTGIAAWLLTRYSSSILALMRLRRPIDLEKALEAQKAYWKFAGICAIVSLILALLMMVVAIVIVVVNLR